MIFFNEPCQHCWRRCLSHRPFGELLMIISMWKSLISKFPQRILSPILSQSNLGLGSNTQLWHPHSSGPSPINLKTAKEGSGLFWVLNFKCSMDGAVRFFLFDGICSVTAFRLGTKGFSILQQHCQLVGGPKVLVVASDNSGPLDTELLLRSGFVIVAWPLRRCKRSRFSCVFFQGESC